MLANPIKAVDTRDVLAKQAGVSHGTFDKVRTIEAKATDEEKAALSVRQ